MEIINEQKQQEGREALVLTTAGYKKSTQVSVPGGHFRTITDLTASDREHVPSLPSGAPALDLSLKKIPVNNRFGGMMQAWLYFSKVWDKQKSEAFIHWHYDAELDCYMMVVPPFYTATAAALDYPTSTQFCRVCQVGMFDGVDTCPHCGTGGDIKPLAVFGTSHSHGSLAAFHSSTDHANEMNQTGFHITFGLIEKGPVIAPSFVVAGTNTRFNTAWQDHFALAEDPEVVAFAPILERWLTLVDTGGGYGSYKVTGVVPEFEGRSRVICEAYVKAKGGGVISSSGYNVGRSDYVTPTVISSKITTGPPMAANKSWVDNWSKGYGQDRGLSKKERRALNRSHRLTSGGPETTAVTRLITHITSSPSRYHLIAAMWTLKEVAPASENILGDEFMFSDAVYAAFEKVTYNLGGANFMNWADCAARLIREFWEDADEVQEAVDACADILEKFELLSDALLLRLRTQSVDPDDFILAGTDDGTTWDEHDALRNAPKPDYGRTAWQTHEDTQSLWNSP